MKGRLAALGLATVLCANAYTWDYTSPTPWQGSGPWVANTNGWGEAQLSTGLAFPYGGSFIYTPTVSGANPNDYDMQSTLTLNEGATFIHFLRASSTTVQEGVGTYVSAELTATYGPGSAVINFRKCVNGTMTLLASTQVTVTPSTIFRTTIFGTNLWAYINGALVAQVTVPAGTGQPGVGGGFGNEQNGGLDAFTTVQIGQHWTTAPGAVPSTSFFSSAYPNEISMKWAPVAPGSDPGILVYGVERNGTMVDYVGWSGPSWEQLEFLDTTVQPSTTYTYSLVTVDIDGNDSTLTNFTITTPPSGTGPGAPPNSFDPRRVGVRNTGSYWGGGGEQIDTTSGNLNFQFPILKAQGRNGWTVPVNLVYNSQNWRNDNGVNWQYGNDVGFGFGWKMLIGSITPYYVSTGGPLAYFLFIDNTGSEYRLDQQNGTIWSSLQSTYVWFDTSADKLHFKDGTFWVMGSVSGGNEADAGTMYPTTIEDVNGNQVLVTYDYGAGLPTTDKNTSARIVTIEDVRATHTLVSCPPNGSGTCNNLTYFFQYNHATSVAHLTSFYNYIGTSEAGSFVYTTSELSPPFGADVNWYGKTTTQLSSYQVGQAALLGTYQFMYDGVGAQELLQVTFPWGGHLAWNYQTFAYAGGRSLREVATRYLAADSAGANVWTYPITRPDAPNSVQVHSSMTLADASGNGAKTWNFLTTVTASATWQVGLASDFAQKAAASSTYGMRHDFYTWSQDPAGNPYISSKTSLTDEGMSYQQSALSTQTLDQYGNGTQSVIYPYNNTSASLYTYNNTYLGDSGTYPDTGAPAQYIESYIRNHLVTSTVTTGGNNYTLAQNTYDFGYPGSLSGTFYELDANPPVPYYERGWMTQSATPAKTTTISYYTPGGILAGTSATDGTTTAVSTSSTTNFAAPQSIATQSYSQTLSYNSWLGMTQTTGANGEQLSMTYDVAGRPSTGTSPYGAVTTYTYSAYGALPMQQTVTGPNGVTITTLDGLGRAIRVQRGDSATVDSTTSYTDTVYAPCACSPLSKVQKVSRPYVPGGTPVWTVYSYDGIGRTVSTVQPDGASTTTYAYAGNTTTVTDPAGKWKQYTKDVLGNLTTVLEPDPNNQPSGTLTTSYTYDWMNHVTQVAMTRGSTTQYRTFVYDNAGRMTSATNPENGTVTYTYSSDNTLQDKHDAKGQDTVYTYDSKKRVTMVQRYPSGKNNAEDTSQRVTYSYDTNPYSSTFSHNSTGRLTAVLYPVHAASQTVTEMYSYHPAGAVTEKSFQMGTATPLTVSYGYTSAGQVATMQYPSTSSFTLTYGYDAMDRLSTLSEALSPGQTTLVPNVQYDYAGRMTGIQYPADTYSINSATYTQETMTYNVNGQLASLAWGPPSGSNVSYYNSLGPTGEIQYNYSATQNNGQITQAVDTLSGETIGYQYDALKRLTSASSTPIIGSTPTAWTQTYQYDGFGNLTAKVLNGTSTPIAVNASTNQLTNANYDANGNMTSGVGATFTYDVANRQVSAAETFGGTEYYGYAPDNKRVFRQLANGTQQITFYGARGEKLSSGEGMLVWFGGKLIADGVLPNNIVPVYQDRLGINRGNGTYNVTNNGARFYPFGDEITSTSNDRVKFGTYSRDSYTGLDYADQRFYASSYGRFNTPDRKGRKAAKKKNPQSWNRYAYALGDPVNRNDPKGTCSVGPDGTYWDDDWTDYDQTTIWGLEYEGYDYLYDGDCTLSYYSIEVDISPDDQSDDVPLGDILYANSVIQQVNSDNPGGMLSQFMVLSAAMAIPAADFVGAANAFAEGASAANAIMLGPSTNLAAGYSGYVEIGGVVGANTLSMTSAQWAALGLEGQEAAMAGFIDGAINRGAQIIFTSNPSLAAAAGNVGTGFEYNYLTGTLGYQIVQQGTSWVAVAP